MIESIFAKGSYVAVAVGFDDHTPALVQFAAKLAKRSGKKLALVHVVETPLVARPVRPFAVPAVIWDKMPELMESTRAEAKRKLVELKKTVKEEIEVRTIVTDGPTVDALVKEAQHVDAAVLIVGTRVNKKLYVPRGFSTAMSLMAEAPLPVLAIDTERHLPEFDMPMRILLADDLSEGSEPAVAVAASLADGMGQTWVHHVHVSALTAENLQTALVNAALTAHSSLDLKEADAVFKSVRAGQRDELEARFSDFREIVEAGGGKYSSEVVSGTVGAELDLAVKTYHPDVMVFGRHHGVHRKPFFFGRMPLRAMMGYGIPVLVVPGANDE